MRLSLIRFGKAPYSNVVFMRTYVCCFCLLSGFSMSQNSVSIMCLKRISAAALFHQLRKDSKVFYGAKKCVILPQSNQRKTFHSEGLGRWLYQMKQHETGGWGKRNDEKMHFMQTSPVHFYICSEIGGKTSGSLIRRLLFQCCLGFNNLFDLKSTLHGNCNMELDFIWWNKEIER